MARNPRRDRRFRVIHAWYPSAREVERIGRLGLIVDITPQQLVNDLRAVDAKLGRERARTAHAWRTLARAGARLDIVSDWPGSFNEQRATPLAPLENIALAMTRAAPGGVAWHPDEAIGVHDAIVAYTANPAYASYEEERKGSITTGKLADLVVLSRNILNATAAEIRATRVLRTIVGGRTVYAAGGRFG